MSEQRGYEPPQEKNQERFSFRGAAKKLKKKVNEVLEGAGKEKKPENQIAEATSFPELFAVLENIGPIQGSREIFAFDVSFRMINDVLNHKKTFGAITSTHGLRQKVKELYGQRISKQIESAFSIDEIFQALENLGKIQGDREILSASQVQFTISRFISGADVSDRIPEIGSIKGQVETIMKNEKLADEIQRAQNFDQLMAILKRADEIRVKSGTYSYDYLKEQIGKYRTGSWSEDGITKSLGLRDKVKELAFDEFAGNYDRSRSGRDQSQDQQQGGNPNYGGARDSQERGARQEQQNSISERIASAKNFNELKYYLRNPNVWVAGVPGSDLAARIDLARTNRDFIAEMFPEAEGLRDKIYQLYDQAEASGEGNENQFNIDREENFDPVKLRQVMKDISRMRSNPGFDNKKVYRKLSREKYHPDHHGIEMTDYFKILTAWNNNPELYEKYL